MPSYFNTSLPLISGLHWSWFPSYHSGRFCTIFAAQFFSTQTLTVVFSWNNRDWTNNTSLFFTHGQWKDTGQHLCYVTISWHDFGGHHVRGERMWRISNSLITAFNITVTRVSSPAKTRHITQPNCKEIGKLYYVPRNEVHGVSSVNFYYTIYIPTTHQMVRLAQISPPTSRSV